MTVTLQPCPFCGGNNIETDCFNAAFDVPACDEDCFDYCKDCDAQGPPAASSALAHERWNARGPTRGSTPYRERDRDDDAGPMGPIPGAAA